MCQFPQHTEKIISFSVKVDLKTLQETGWKLAFWGELQQSVIVTSDAL